MEIDTDPQMGEAEEKQRVHTAVHRHNDCELNAFLAAHIILHYIVYATKHKTIY